MNNLAPGKYYATLLVYEEGEYGNIMRFDRVEHAMNFEIIDNNEITWNSNWWGCIRMNDIKLIESLNVKK